MGKKSLIDLLVEQDKASYGAIVEVYSATGTHGGGVKGVYRFTTEADANKFITALTASDIGDTGTLFIALKALVKGGDDFTSRRVVTNIEGEWISLYPEKSEHR